MRNVYFGHHNIEGLSVYLKNQDADALQKELVVMVTIEHNQLC